MQIPKEVTKLFYPVKKVEAKDYAPDLDFPPEREFFIIRPDSDNLVLASCSDQYQIITNEELIRPLYESLSKEHNIELKVRWMDEAAFKLDFIFKNHRMKKLKVGDLFPRVSMLNSYDKSIKLGFDLGFYRLACENGASVPHGERIHIKTVHKSIARESMRKSMEGIEAFLANANNIVDSYDPLIENKMRMNQAQDRINELIEEKIFPERSAELAMNRLRLEANQGEEINDFLVYNAMNWALNNNVESKTKITKIDETDRAVLDYLIAN